MIKLIAFDLDLTLAPEAGPTSEKDAKRIKKLAESGIRIAVCSGKPTYYLCGFLRQLGVRNPIMIGENGCVIQFGLDLPPKDYYVMPVKNEAKNSICTIKDFINQKYPDMWYQPNVTALTPFPAQKEQFDTISGFIEQNRENLSGVTVYQHYDSFDIIPTGMNKRTGLEFVCKKLGIDNKNVAAVGDGINDYPMFDFAEYAVGINVKDKTRVTEDFNTLSDALTFIEKAAGI